jgi:hypothetical protein
MDNFYFIGYRIDIPKPMIECDYEVMKYINKEIGADEIDYSPEGKWLCWSSTDNNVKVSILARKFEDITSDYRCPIDREELWLEMHGYINPREVGGRTFDVPESYPEDIKKIENSDVFKIIKSKWGNVKIRWGIFLGLG